MKKYWKNIQKKSPRLITRQKLIIYSRFYMRKTEYPRMKKKLHNSITLWHRFC